MAKKLYSFDDHPEHRAKLDAWRDKWIKIGELLSVDLPGSPNSRFLRVRCGTGRTFVLSVPQEIRAAMEAQEWMWQVPPGGYRPEART